MEEMSLMSYIPLGLVIKILKRLPVKSLLRFRSVCRLWRSLISSHDFMTLHYQHHNHVPNEFMHDTNTSILFKQYDTKNTSTYSLHRDDENGSFAEIAKFDFPFKARGSHFIIMGCINGLVALWDGVDGGSNTVILWNPAVKKCLTLPTLDPEPHLDFFEFDGWDLWYGFGYEGTNDDYKVVRVLFFFEGTPTPVASRVDIFSFNTRFWRSVSASPPFRVLGFCETRAYQPFHLNGVVYWLTAEPYIVTFDLEKETFGEIKWPWIWTPKEDWTDEIANFRGLLSLIRWQERTKLNGAKVDIWVMTENGVAEPWTKLFALDLLFISRDVCTRKVGGFTRKGALILAGNICLPKLSYIEKLEVIVLQLDGRIWSWNVEPYVESLLLVEGGEDLPVAII